MPPGRRSTPCAASAVSTAPREPGALLDLGGLRRVFDGLRAGEEARRASICATSAATSSSVACTVSTHEAAEMAEIGFGGRALHFEAATLRRGRLRAPCAPRGSRTSCASNCPRSSCDASSAVRTCSRRSSNVRRSSSSWRSDARDALAQLLARGRRCACSSSERVTTRCSSSRAGVLEALHLDRQRAGALDQRRVRGLGFGGHAATGARRVSRASNSLRCAADSCSSAARCSVSMRWIDWRASSSRCSCARSSSSALRRSTRDLLLLARHALRGVAGGRHLQVVADDRLLLAMELGLQRGDRGLGGGDRHVEAGRFLEQPDERRVARPRRARAAP